MADAVTLRLVVQILTALALMAFIWAIIRVINSADNELEWAHLFSSRSADGRQYADWNKIGQGCGIVLSMWIPAIYTNSEKADGTGVAFVLGASLLYLGGVSSYAATLRARRGTVETTSTTESPSRTTETKTETPTP